MPDDPTGSPTPSPDDATYSERLKQAMEEEQKRAAAAAQRLATQRELLSAVEDQVLHALGRLNQHDLGDLLYHTVRAILDLEYFPELGLTQTQRQLTVRLTIKIPLSPRIRRPDA